MTTQSATLGKLRQLADHWRETQDVEILTTALRLTSDLADEFALRNALVGQIMTLGWRLGYFNRDGPFGRALADAHFSLVDDLILVAPPPPLEEAGQKSSTICLVSSQFLAPGHAPTGVALDLADAFDQLHQLLPAIIGANSLYLEKTDPYFLLETANKLQLSGANWVEVRGGRRLIFAPPTDPLVPSKLVEIYDFLQRLRPRAVVAVGGFNPVADVLARRFPTLCVPTVTQGTVTGAHVLLDSFSGNPPTGWLTRTNSHPPVARFRVPTKLPTITRPWQRNAFALDPGGILCAVAGNRLEGDITPVFEALLGRLLAEIPQSRILIVGGNQAYEPKTAALGPRPGRLSILPGSPAIGDILGAADLYLDTPAPGGGTLALLALRSGVPVFSLDELDCAAIFSPRRRLVGLEEMEAAALAFCRDPSERAAWADEVNHFMETRFDFLISGNAAQTDVRQLIDLAASQLQG